MIYLTLKDYIERLKAYDNAKPEKRNVLLYKEVEKPLNFNARLNGHLTTRTTALASFDFILEGLDKTKTYAQILLQRVTPSIKTLIENHAYAALYRTSLFRLSLNNDKTLGSQLQILTREKNHTYEVDAAFIYLFDNGKFTKAIPIQSLQTYSNETNFILDVVQTLPLLGLMRSILINEIFRYDMLIENANYLRKLKGILQILDKGSSAESNQNAALAAKTAIRDNYVITDDFIEFRLNQITAAGGAASFKDFIDMINSDNAIAMLGQANTSQLPDNGGSRAALQILNLISKDIFYSDMIRTEYLCNNYLAMDYKLNYGGINPPYKFKFNIAEEIDREKNASALQMVSAVLDLKEDEAYSFVGFTPPAEGDKILKTKNQL